VRQALLIAAASTVIVLAAVGTAAATTTSSSLFISRGDVIAFVGKDALVPNPVITHATSWNQSWTCTYADASSVTTSAVVHDAVLYNGVPRFAPGNGAITGYSLGAPFTAFFDPVPCATSLAGHGLLTQETLLSSTLQNDQVLFQNAPVPVAFPS
jgi:hypothetical protein